MFDAFLKIEEIPGESTDEKHEDWIELLDINHGVSHALMTAGRASTVRAQVRDFQVKKYVDQATPTLYMSCCVGRHFPEVKIDLCRAAGDKLPYLQYKLTDVVITQVETLGSAKKDDALPMETVTLAFQTIEWTYTKQRRLDGTGGGQVWAQYELAEKD
jgi:type VI secretion system secreted protein Hcp